MYSAATGAELLRNKARRVIGEYLPDCLFENLPENNQRIVRSWLLPDDGSPIVVFRRNDTTWTVLTERRLVSSVEGVRSVVPLERVRVDFELRGDEETEAKEAMNWIQFPGFSHWVWTPSANHASLLLNTMFIVFHRNKRRN